MFDSWNRSSRHALYFLFQKGLYFALIWVILIVYPRLLSVFAIGLTMLLSVSLYLVLQYSWVTKKLPVDYTKEKLVPMVLSIARSNIYVWLAGLGLLSFGPLNQVLLKHYHGPGELGGYAVAWMMVTIASILLSQVARIGSPATARITARAATNNQKIYFLFKYVVLMMVITIPVALPGIIAPDYILKTLFRPEYILAAPVLRIMSVYIFIIGVDLVVSQYILSMRMEMGYLFSVLFGSLVALILCIILIPSAGAVGAAWALLISHGILVSIYCAKIGYSLKS